MKRLFGWLAAALVGVAGLSVGGLALADGHFASDGTVAACVHDRTGALRVDVAGTGCRSNESAVALGAGLVTRTVSAAGSLTHPGFNGVAAECSRGEVVLGGGFEVASINPDIGIVTNAPITLPDGRQAWQVTMHSAVSSGDPTPFSAFAVCALGAAG
jgi:hypothetical protein